MATKVTITPQHTEYGDRIVDKQKLAVYIKDHKGEI